MPIASDLISQSKRVVLLPTAQWIERRRVMQHLTKPNRLQAYTEMQELESVHILANYLFRPEEWYLHHYRYANSFMHRIVLGEGILKRTAELLELQRITIQFLKMIGDSVIDFFPQGDEIASFLAAVAEEDIGNRSRASRCV